MIRRQPLETRIPKPQTPNPKPWTPNAGGQMGNGITQISAAAGINVNMVDVSEELLSKCALYSQA